MFELSVNTELSVTLVETEVANDEVNALEEVTPFNCWVLEAICVDETTSDNGVEEESSRELSVAISQPFDDVNNT